jgi:TetR/AcrR family transcriptional regulator, transcriptional repressor for nem operon
MKSMPHATQSTMTKSRGPGRPREFDMDHALDKAIGVFREQGFHATSVGDLSGAMELASGSIYKAFKDKRAVFLAAFDRYTSLRNEQFRQVAATGRTGIERVRNVLAFYVKSAQGAEGRRGCLVVGSAVEMAVCDPEIAARVTTALKKNEAFLAELIRLGQSDGSIPPAVEPENTARVMVCLTQGLRVVGKSGRALPEPATIVGIALKLLG